MSLWHLAMQAGAAGTCPYTDLAVLPRTLCSCMFPFNQAELLQDEDLQARVEGSAS